MCSASQSQGSCTLEAVLLQSVQQKWSSAQLASEDEYTAPPSRPTYLCNFTNSLQNQSKEQVPPRELQMTLTSLGAAMSH